MKKRMLVIAVFIIIAMIGVLPASGDNGEKRSYSPWFRDISTGECTIIYRNITVNTTWDEDGSPYYVVNKIYVKNNTVLTIKKGAAVIFSPESGIEIDNGSLLDGCGQPSAYTIYYSIDESNQCFSGTYDFMRCEFWNMPSFHISDHSESRIYHCNFYNCDGIVLGGGNVMDEGSSHSIVHCIFVENQDPLRITSDMETHQIYENSFIDCIYTQPLGVGIWSGPSNSSGRGNYWSDYDGIDTDDDGIGDTKIPWHDVDWRPIIEPLSDDYRTNWDEWNMAPIDDGDYDGMPDDWEQTYSLDQNNRYDALIDNDNDGLTNLEECIGGSNPNIYNGPPRPPMADFTYKPQIPDQGEIVWFKDVSAAFNGTIVSWSWDLGDGNWSSEQDPSHSYSVPGAYTVILTVTDNIGFINTTSMIITVLEEVIPPNMEIKANVTTGAAPLNVTFSSSLNHTDGYTYYWDFGDGNTSQEKNTTYLFKETGNYIVTLTVKDGNNRIASDSMIIAVESEKNPSIDQGDLGEDSDNDGFNNTMENASGSDPYDSKSTPFDWDGDGATNDNDTSPNNPDLWEAKMGGERTDNMIYTWIGLIIMGFFLTIVVLLVYITKKKKHNKR